MPKTILLVEDNLADVRLLKEALKACHSEAELLHVSDGVEALKFLEDRVAASFKLPNLILLDLNMPRKDGRTLLQELKAHNLFKAIPVIIMSTSANPSDINDCYLFGANSYVTKPVELERFFHVISVIDSFWLKLVR